MIRFADVLRAFIDLLMRTPYVRLLETQALQTRTDMRDRLADKDRVIADLRVRLANAMAKNNLVALAYPHQKRLPVMIGDMNQAERNGILASITGFPAITVPAGFSAATARAPIGVSVGIEFLGQPFSEPQLLKIAYSFEQATHARKPPQSTPPLGGR